MSKITSQLRPNEEVLAKALARGPERPGLTAFLMLFFVIPGIVHHEFLVRRYEVVLTSQRLLIAPLIGGSVMSWERSALPPMRALDTKSWARLEIDGERSLRLRFWRLRRGGNWRDGYRVIFGLLGRDMAEADTIERSETLLDWALIVAPIAYFGLFYLVLRLLLGGSGKG